MSATIKRILSTGDLFMRHPSPDHEAASITRDLRAELTWGVSFARAVSLLPDEEREVLRRVARLARERREEAREEG